MLQVKNRADAEDPASAKDKGSVMREQNACGTVQRLSRVWLLLVVCVVALCGSNGTASTMDAALLWTEWFNTNLGQDGLANVGRVNWTALDNSGTNTVVTGRSFRRVLSEYSEFSIDHG